jgi:hypothetical protein
VILSDLRNLYFIMHNFVPILAVSGSRYRRYWRIITYTGNYEFASNSRSDCESVKQDNSSGWNYSTGKSAFVAELEIGNCVFGKIRNWKGCFFQLQYYKRGCFCTDSALILHCFCRRRNAGEEMKETGDTRRFTGRESCWISTCQRVLLLDNTCQRVSSSVVSKRFAEAFVFCCEHRS